MPNNIYQFTNLLAYPQLHHGVSTKACGSMKKEDGSIDFAHLETLRNQLGITEREVTMQQIHSGNVVTVADTTHLRFAETDGLVTNQKGIPLTVLTADCLPILFFDPKKGVISVAHAGYRGLLRHIIEHTVDRMQKEFGSDPKDLVVGIGPSIETMCYEVGEEVIDEFESTYPLFENMFVEKEGKYFLNLREIAEQSLRATGIEKAHIEVANVCTKCDDRFYSYRGGDINKRFGSIIALI